MTTTQALDIEYRKVVPAQYTDKRDGSPLGCMTCGSNLVKGQAFAARTSTGWHSYCSLCARSPQAQIAGLLERIETLVAPLGDDIPVEVTQVVDQATPLVEAVLAGNTNQFLNAKSLLLAVRTLVGEAKRQATPDPLIDALKALVASEGNSFAGSLLAWFDKHGSLTTNQRSAAERLVAERAAKAERAAQAEAQRQAQSTVFTVPEKGLYRDDNDGTVRRVYKTGRGRISARKYNGVRFVYEGNAGLRTVAEGLDAGTTRLLTAAEASAFGKGIGRCFNCMSIGRPGYLTDDRSLAVGYGPDCAQNNGWWYPTADEAGKILHGSFDLDAKLTQALVPLVPVTDDELTALLDAEQDIADQIVTAHEVEDIDDPEALPPQATVEGIIEHGGTLYLDEDYECPMCGRVTGFSNGVPTCDNCGWSAGPPMVEDSFAGALVPGEGEALDPEGNIIDNPHWPHPIEPLCCSYHYPVYEDDERQARADYDTKVEHGIPPVAPVVTPECAWCHKAPGTLSFVCEDAEAHRVCPTCRPVLVAGNRCPFHA